jgi:hypothetical protein
VIWSEFMLLRSLRKVTTQTIGDILYTVETGVVIGYSLSMKLVTRGHGHFCRHSILPNRDSETGRKSFRCEWRASSAH